MNTNDIKIIREALEKCQRVIRDEFGTRNYQAYGMLRYVCCDGDYEDRKHRYGCCVVAGLQATQAALAALARMEAQQPRVRYRSKVSGMWYETLEAAGDVDCVEVDGVQFCQENGVKCLTQQQPKRLTDEDIERIANYESEFPKHFGDGLRYARDNGYLGGLSVEEVEKVALTWLQLDCGISEAIDKEDMDDLRARLTAKLNSTNK